MDVKFTKWTEYETGVLKANKDSRSCTEIARYLGRSYRSVVSKKYSLKRSHNRDFWTDKQKEFLADNYGKMQVSKLAALLGRSRHTTYVKAFHLGLTVKDHHKTKWSDSDTEFLKLNYKNMTNGELAFAIGRKKTVTRLKLYELGLARKDKKGDKWNENETALVRYHFRVKGNVEIASMLPGRSPEAVQGVLKRLDLSRTKEEITGILSRNNIASDHGYKTGQVHCNRTKPDYNKGWATRRKKERDKEPVLISLLLGKRPVVLNGVTVFR